MLMRVLYNLFIFVSILTMPWYSYALFILAGFFLFNKYIEGVVYSAWIDAVFGGALNSSFSMSDIWNHYLFTVFGVIAYMLVDRLKISLSWYD